MSDKDKIGVASTYGELTGIGTEYVIVDDIVIAKFLNGNLDLPCSGNSEKTK